MMFKFERTSYSNIEAILFGLVKIVDGLVPVLTLGFFKTNGALVFAQRVARKRYLASEQ